VRIPVFLAKLLIRTGIARHLPVVQRLSGGAGPFLHHYSNRVLAAPLADLRAAAQWQGLPEPGGIDLSLGAPRFDLVPSGSTKLPEDRRGFPPAWGLLELREAIADRVRAEAGLAVRPDEEVLVTHGAAGAFSVALDTFVNPGDKVVLFDPTSPLYPLALRQRRARVRWVPTLIEEGRIRFRQDLLARALNRARLVVVTSPANPTGGVFAAEDLEEIAWWAERHDVLIFSDIVFAHYRYEGEVSSIGTMGKACQRTVTAGSLSKTFGLAALRVGWLAGPRHLVHACALTGVLQTPFVPTLCQQLALAALRQPEDALTRVRSEFASRRCYTHERLLALGLRSDLPSGAFFFWVPVQGLGRSGRAFAQELRRVKKVLVWPGEFFGPSGRGHIRLSYAVEDGRLREGLARLGEFVRLLQDGAPAGLPRAA
jgi:aspartate/methionine/tyrosine aminotransferase